MHQLSPNEEFEKITREVSNGLGVCTSPKSTAGYMPERQLFPPPSPGAPNHSRAGELPVGSHLTSPRPDAQPHGGSNTLIFFVLLSSVITIVLSSPMARFHFIFKNFKL